jgi:hypothetical protein
MVHVFFFFAFCAMNLTKRKQPQSWLFYDWLSFQSKLTKANWEGYIDELIMEIEM